jgi:hypothetical protein
MVRAIVILRKMVGGVGKGEREVKVQRAENVEVDSMAAIIITMANTAADIGVATGGGTTAVAAATTTTTTGATARATVGVPRATITWQQKKK